MFSTSIKLTDTTSSSHDLTHRSMFNSHSSFHLKPLSVYSHMVCSERENGPLYNIRVHITNDELRGQKRRLDSCVEEICETPRKKPCITRSCSQDLGYFSSDFPSGVLGSTPLRPLLISKDVTPPRSKVNQSVTPVVSTPLYESTPHRMDRDRESLPSPIPVLKWDREVSSAEVKLGGSLNLDAGSSAPSVCSQGCGKGEVRTVSHHHVSAHEPQSRASPGSAVPPEEGEVVSVSEQAEPEATDPHDVSGGESFESTLPLQLQVKSKVVVPDPTETRCGPVSCSEEEWERNKRTYVDSVTRHMKEQNGAANGVIHELHSLMNCVARQNPGGNDPHWRHPSDLTRRNFLKSRVSAPSVSLDEWQKRNLLAYRRFANVPDIFHRSPVL